MSDPVETMLEGLSPGPEATRPPPAYLRAVARRRHRRQLAQAGVLAGLLLAGMTLWRVAPWTRPAPMPERVITSGPGTEGFSLHAVSLAALTRANSQTDVDALTLPEPAGSGPAQELRLGMRADRLEQWLGR